MRLKDKVIIITGGGKGIGKVYSERLAAEGAKVIVADIDLQAAQETVKTIRNSGGEALPVETDVSNLESAKKMAKAAVQNFQRIDVLINNAALASAIPRKQWFEITEEEWEQVMNVNLKGTFLCCLAVFPYMKEQGKGKMINISSGKALSGSPVIIHYTSSKAGIIGFSRALAREEGDCRINVNIVTPDFTDTGLWDVLQEEIEKRNQKNVLSTPKA